MSEDTNDYSSSINKVMAVCEDPEEGFRGAANAVKDPSLQLLFNQLSSQRGELAKDLRAAVASAGLKPEDSAGVLGTLHHGWIALKGVLTGHSEHQFLEATERGEDFSISRYRDPWHIKYRQRCVLLESQYQQVRASSQKNQRAT